MFGHATRDGGWVDGDTNPEDDPGFFVADAVILRELRLSRVGKGDLDV